MVHALRGQVGADMMVDCLFSSTYSIQICKNEQITFIIKIMIRIMINYLLLEVKTGKLKPSDTHALILQT